jgi:hypothetical protein
MSSMLVDAAVIGLIGLVFNNLLRHKGSQPAELPVLVINLRTAKAMLGLDVLATLRACADEVIE